MPKSNRPGRPVSPDGRRADPAINSYAQWRVERWLKENPDKLATNLAEDFGLSDYAISTLRNKGEGVGWVVARALARAFGLTLSEFIAEADKYWEEQQRAQPVGFERLSDRPEWAAVIADAVTRLGVSKAEAESVGEWRANLPGKLTAETLAAFVGAAKGTTKTTRPTRRR